MTKHKKPIQKATAQKVPISLKSKSSSLPHSSQLPNRLQTPISLSELDDDDETSEVEGGSELSNGSSQADGELEEVEEDDGDDEYEDVEGTDDEEGEGIEDVVDDDEDEDFETEDSDEHQQDNDSELLDEGQDGFVTDEEEEIEEPQSQPGKQAAPFTSRSTSKKQLKHASKKPSLIQPRQAKKKPQLWTKPTHRDSDEDSEEGLQRDPVTANLVKDEDESGEWSTDDEDEDEDGDYVDTRPSRAPFENQVSVRLSDEQDEAIRVCRAKVERIVKACRAGNRKFRDIEFDLLNDKVRTYYGLLPMDPDSNSDDEESDSDEDEGSEGSSSGNSDASDSNEAEQSSSDEEDDDEASDAESDGLPDVRRVTEIFDTPKFFADAPGSNDVVQGTLGDCWFLSALSATSTVPGLIERCCVARDEEVGVYGFIFQHDGRWVSVVVDDQLFWGLPKFEELSSVEQELYHDDKELYNTINRKTGKGLHMSQSGRAGETWVPLIEKAFAKLHGDYKSLDGGWTGEAIEDLTGGVTTTIKTTDILDIDRFWEEELCLVNTHQRLFAVGYWLESNQPGTTTSGLVPGHAYSVLRVQECRGKRFLVIRNPWGKFEWNGPWSDGSKEWNGEWIGVLKELGHNLGDDGTFIMEYKDFLSHWETIQSTTLFDSSWILSSHWALVPSHPPFHPWTFGDVIFNFTLPKACKAYVVLSQLDARYFKLLEGNATWNLEFAVYKRGDSEPMGVSYSGQFFDRSVTCVLDLDQGEYLVFPRVDRFDNKLSGFMKECIEYFDKRKLSRVLSERTTARAIASNFDLGLKLHHMPQTLYEAIDDDLSGSEDDESDEEEEADGGSEDDNVLLDEDVLEVRTITTTTTSQVVEETVATNPRASILTSSTRQGSQPSSFALPETVTAALGVKDTPSKGFIIVLDSEKDLVGKPVRFGPWTEKEIEEDENEENMSDEGDGTTDDNTTVDGESEGPCKGDISEGPLLEDITGDDEDMKPLWLGLKVYMRLEDALHTTPVTIGSFVPEDIASEVDDRTTCQVSKTVFYPLPGGTAGC